MKDRIRQLMESQHMTQQIFANFLEMSPATLSSIFNDRTKPTLNVVEAIKKKIPLVNINWLMFGIGDMFVSPTDGGDDSATVSDENSNVKIGSSGDTDLAIDFDLLGGDSVVHTNSSGRQSKGSEPAREEIRYIERPPRKVVEIRVYYDDLTYETFAPAKK